VEVSLARQQSRVVAGSRTASDRSHQRNFLPQQPGAGEADDRTLFISGFALIV
jgi:hypothetical protein